MEYLCPECDERLILYANGDNGPQDDRWTCGACGIEYPHSEFPLPKGYVRDARIAERVAELKERREDDRAALAAWNKWAKGA